jgi:hypothetical protein
VTTLQAARSAVRLWNIRLSVKPAHPSVQLVPGCYFSGVNRPFMKLTIHLHLMPKLRMCGAIPLHPLRAIVTWRATLRIFICNFVFQKVKCHKCLTHSWSPFYTSAWEVLFYSSIVLHTPYTIERGSSLEANRFSASQDIQLRVQRSRLQLYHESFQNFYCFRNCSNCIAVKKTSQTAMASRYL